MTDFHQDYCAVRKAIIEQDYAHLNPMQRKGGHGDRRAAAAAGRRGQRQHHCADPPGGQFC